PIVVCSENARAILPFLCEHARDAEAPGMHPRGRLRTEVTGLLRLLVLAARGAGERLPVDRNAIRHGPHVQRAAGCSDGVEMAVARGEQHAVTEAREPAAANGRSWDLAMMCDDAQVVETRGDLRCAAACI